MFTLRFDMRAPPTGAPTHELYAAALDIIEWAEDHGAITAVMSEHHGAPDGYLPAPLTMMAAAAARTKRIPLSVAIMQFPLYNPVQLAEQMCVIDILSKGRASFFGGLGYLPSEYESLGVDFKQRGRIADEKLAILVKAVTGEPFEHEGRRIHVTPAPYTPGGPRIGWGGGSIPAAQRAGRLGLDFMAQTDDPALGEAYQQAAREHGRQPGMCILPSRALPSAVFVADDLDRAWEEVGPYIMHDAQVYADWNEGRDNVSSVSFAPSIDAMRAENGAYRILTVEQAVGLVRSGVPLVLHPLIGGLPPEIAWRYLRIVADQVMPALRQ